MGNVTPEKLKHWAEENNVKKLKKAIDHDPSFSQTRFPDFFDETLLHFACRRGSTQAVELLLEAGADPNEKDERNTTPLIEACTSGKREIVEALLKAGAAESLDVYGGEFNYTPLQETIACAGILDLPDPKEKEEQWADYEEREAIVQILVEEYEKNKSLDINTTSPKLGCTALDMIADQLARPHALVEGEQPILERMKDMVEGAGGELRDPTFAKKD